MIRNLILTLLFLSYCSSNAQNGILLYLKDDSIKTGNIEYTGKNYIKLSLAGSKKSYKKYYAQEIKEIKQFKNDKLIHKFYFLPVKDKLSSTFRLILFEEIIKPKQGVNLYKSQIFHINSFNQVSYTYYIQKKPSGKLIQLYSAGFPFNNPRKVVLKNLSPCPKFKKILKNKGFEKYVTSKSKNSIVRREFQFIEMINFYNKNCL